MSKRKIKLAIVGGNRGGAFNSTLELLADKVELTAICDIDEKKIEEWKQNFPQITGYTLYDDMLQNGDIDAVFIATPVFMHYSQTKKALQMGKHVLCEVFAATTLDEMQDLIRSVEESKLVYMMAENYIYMRPNMMILNMMNKGVFGDITYAEGGYIHDCRSLRIDEAGVPTWRDKLMKQRSNNYPTHSLGPIAKWLGLTERDQMKSCTTFVSRRESYQKFVRKRFGNDYESLLKGDISGDSVISIIECESKALIVLRTDINSLRPHNMVHYQLQGTAAAYLSSRHEAEDGLLWVDGTSEKHENETAGAWDNMYKHAYTYEHPLWKTHMAQARKLGHGGGDFFVLREFVDAILNNRRPFIDIYDAVAWSSIVPLSAESVKKGGIPINIPNFPRRD